MSKSSSTKNAIEKENTLMISNLLSTISATALTSSLEAKEQIQTFLASHKLFCQFLMMLDYTSFLKEAVTAMKYVVIAVGGGLAILGAVNLLEGYGNDNPGAKSQGMKQFMAGAGVMMIGFLLVPSLKDLIPTSLAESKK